MCVFPELKVQTLHICNSLILCTFSMSYTSKVHKYIGILYYILYFPTISFLPHFQNPLTSN
nr:MAG TPA: hypothetical protein [Bacteriophage sp.]